MSNEIRPSVHRLPLGSQDNHGGVACAGVERALGPEIQVLCQLSERDVQGLRL